MPDITLKKSIDDFYMGVLQPLCKYFRIKTLPEIVDSGKGVKIQMNTPF